MHGVSNRDPRNHGFSSVGSAVATFDLDLVVLFVGQGGASRRVWVLFGLIRVSNVFCVVFLPAESVIHPVFGPLLLNQDTNNNMVVTVASPPSLASVSIDPPLSSSEALGCRYVCVFVVV